ncbi:LysE family translocator [Kiloniella sp. b19]|uniref:LysE family translocator n=1 Tax=Kiloniella sp. GXU_MW_B19 TaxID=3141326 RepID=UPI0031E483E1
MIWSDVLSFAIVTSLMVMSPGPNGLLIARTVPTSGRAAGCANIAGFVAALFLHGSLSILGLSIILVQSATAFALVKYLGAAYLCWIGCKALHAAWKGVPRSEQQITPAKNRRTLLRAFGEGLLTNALNPKVSMFYLAAFPQFITPGQDSALNSLFLISLHATVVVLWFGSMILLLTGVRKATRSDRFQRWLKGATGAAFVGFGLKLASYKPNV